MTGVESHARDDEGDAVVEAALTIERLRGEVKALREYCEGTPYAVLATRQRDGAHIRVAAFAQRKYADNFAELAKRDTPGAVGESIRVIDIRTTREDGSPRRKASKGASR